MAEQSWEEFVKSVESSQPPLTGEALKKTEAAAAARITSVPQSKWADPDFATKIGARPGVPFDTETGVPWFTRYKLESQPTEKEQLDFLKRQYGEGNVRTNSYGKPVVTVTEGGATKDVLVNPLGIDWKDTATLAAEAPEVVGSALSMVLSRGATLGPGLMKALGTLGLTALGAQAGGAAKDLFTRWTSGGEANVPEIAGRRAMKGAEDFFFGGALGGAGFVAGRAISPLSSMGRLQFNARDALEHLEGKYGVKLTQTPAEKTGNEFLLAAEALEASKPGARPVFAKMKQQQLDEINELSQIMTGAVPDAEQAGKRVLSAAGSQIAPVDFEIAKSAHKAAEEATARIKDIVGPRVDKTAVGEAIHANAIAKRAAFKVQDASNYDALFSHPKATAFVVEADPLAQSIKRLMGEMFPAVERTVKKPTGILGPTGTPLTVSVTQREILEKQIKPGLQARLEELAATEGGKISLQSLKQIRTDISDAIAIGQAIPGVKEGTLKGAEKALTDAINGGLSRINDPSLTRLWDTARKYHADNVGKFERTGIAEIFRDPTQPGYLSPTELVDRVASGATQAKAQDTYRAYREFFGPTSPEVKGVQQAVRDNVLSLSSLSRTVDAQGLIQRLETLEKGAPDAFQDAFGAAGQVLRDNAQALRAASGETLPKDELVAAINSGNLTSESLRDMLTAQAKRDDMFRNKLLADISKGAMDAERIQPTEVVDRMVFKKDTQPEHLTQVMDMLFQGGKTEAAEDMRRLTFQKVLDKATIPLKSGEWALDATQLEGMLRDESLRKKLVAVLGDDSFEDLANLTDFLKPGNVVNLAAQSAGRLGSASAIAGLVEKGELKYLGRAVQNFIMATIYTSENLRKYLTNGTIGGEGKALLVNGAIASEPFLRALVGTFTKEGSRSIATQAHDAVERMIANDPSSAQPGVTPGAAARVPWDEFLRSKEAVGAER